MKFLIRHDKEKMFFKYFPKNEKPFEEDELTPNAHTSLKDNGWGNTLDNTKNHLNGIQIFLIKIVQAFLPNLTE